MSHRYTPVIPPLTGSVNLRALQDTLAPLHDQNYNSGFGVCQYVHGMGTFNAGAYCGSVYSPTQNRIYMAPQSQAPQLTWHYIQEYSLPEASPTLMASAPFNTI